MRRGAHGRSLKDQLIHLGGVVKRALEPQRLRKAEMFAQEALRRERDHYRLLSEITSDYAYELRVDAGSLICEWASEAFTRITGYSIEEVNSRGWSRLYHPDDASLAHHHQQSLMANQKDVVEVRIITKKGDVRWVRAYGRPLCDGESGQVTYIYGAAQDITTYRHLEQQVLQAQRMEVIGQLVSGVAHDFNNLLTVIFNHGQLLRSTFAAGRPNVEYHLDPILTAADRASQLTGQLLSFSRRQTPKPQPKLLDLNATVTEVERMLRSTVGSSIELQTILCPDLGMVMTDPGQIGLAIMNLVINARDAMPAGGQLIIETANVELSEADARQHTDAHAGPYVLLMVRDTGIGMDNELQSHIFEPFFTTKEVGKGTGLGLAVVRGIVVQSRGYMKVQSQPGQGSTFTIYLPASAKDTGEKPAIFFPPPAV